MVEGMVARSVLRGGWIGEAEREAKSDEGWMETPGRRRVAELGSLIWQRLGS